MIVNNCLPLHQLLSANICCSPNFFILNVCSLKLSSRLISDILIP
uniref:Uncharacterized protein n=1 Tax=Rhizophora mucronata TaxID=61149 RepID=A0A2P2MR28_RHIMU